MCNYLVLLPGSQVKVAKAKVAIASVGWGTGSIAVSSRGSSVVLAIPSKIRTASKIGIASKISVASKLTATRIQT